MNRYPAGVTGNEYAIAGPTWEREGPPCGYDDYCEADTWEQYHPDNGLWRVCSLGHEQEIEAECCDTGPLGHPGRCWRED